MTTIRIVVAFTSTTEGPLREGWRELTAQQGEDFARMTGADTAEVVEVWQDGERLL